VWWVYASFFINSNVFTYGVSYMSTELKQILKESLQEVQMNEARNDDLIASTPKDIINAILSVDVINIQFVLPMNLSYSQIDAPKFKKSRMFGSKGLMVKSGTAAEMEMDFTRMELKWHNKEDWVLTLKNKVCIMLEVANNAKKEAYMY
jgi:hypothetical protein